MRYGIIADIHSNLEALQAVLEAIGKVDSYLCLGDIVGYGADPNACMEIVRGLPGLHVVAGNHDLAVASRYDISYFNPWAAAAVVWTRQALVPEHLVYLKALATREVFEAITLAHGALPDPMEYVLSAADAAVTLRHTTRPLTVIGHTHLAEYYRLSEGERRPRHVAMGRGGVVRLRPEDARPGDRWLVNCGSVGQPRDGSPLAACGVYDTQTAQIEIKRVQYDIAAAQRKIIAAGLPEVLASRLEVGR